MSDLFDQEAKAVVVTDSTDPLIKMVLDKDMGIEVLERIIALRNQEYERKAQAEFEEHFRLLQAKLPVIKKTKEAKDKNGKVMYSYAPLEDIQKTCNEAIQSEGFCYSWREEALAEGTKRVVFKISGWGHYKENFFDIPPIPTNMMTNDVQTRGMQSTYGKRYTFISGFGLVVEGEDNDGKYTVDEYLEYGDLLKSIRDAQTVQELSEAAQKVKLLISQDDTRGRAMLNQTYTKRKAELTGRS